MHVLSSPFVRLYAALLLFILLAACSAKADDNSVLEQTRSTAGMAATTLPSHDGGAAS